MKGAVFALVFAVAVATCYAGSAYTSTSTSTTTSPNDCTCPNLLTGVANLIAQLQGALAPILKPLGGLGNFVKALLSLVKSLVDTLGNALTNGSLLGDLDDLIPCH